ncbi:MAG: DUF1549 and DUF1553 domain-containing protein, partial [Verrucomicrobiota bacterium]|nr:DUF1549 and DUF1553 domain-containing protein [Verrucomicrobiota bacterium]
MSKMLIFPLMATALFAAEKIDIEAGRTHWAFRPIGNPKPPQVEKLDWVKNPIDRFVLAKLESNGLQPSPRATEHVLNRRAHFILTGLPPRPNPKPWIPHSKLVDRLLDSPQYGEHWARHWLDVARYADNKGHVFFEEKSFPWAWTYRDYVIGAFNEDKPFNRFIIEQLAADRLELGEDREALAALGFLTLGPRFSGNIHDILDDRIDVTTRGLMGFTVACARCHEHKNDPVPMADYYSLYGVFRSSVEPTLQPTFHREEELGEERQAFEIEMDKRLKALEDFVAKTRENIITTARTRTAEYLAAVHVKRNQPSTENFMLLTDKGSINPYVIHRWENFLKDAARDNDPVWTVWHRFAPLADDEFAAKAPSIHKELFGMRASIASINGRVYEKFKDAHPKSMKEIIDGYGELFKAVDVEWQKQKTKRTCLVDADAEVLRLVLYGKNSPPMIPRRMGWGFLALIPDRPDQGVYKKLIKAVEQWSMTGKGAPPRAMVLTDIDPPYAPVIFKRGKPHQRGKPVPRQFLEVLDGKDREPFRNGSGRLELARAIASPKNPLTARVIVNRVWGWHFGQGFVATPSDFGLRSPPPSHPELLDWLATDFIKHGWSLKDLHRRIMNSATWQMASTHSNEKAHLADPTNRFLWKFNRQRIGFEGLRDSLVAVTGQLDPKLGGPPVNVLSGF